MLLKLLTLIGVALAIWGFARKAMGAARGAEALRRGAPRRVEAEDLARCPSCGAWGPPGEPCACRTPPTP
jgi:hypothetical protein